eukprot:4132849-Ditylum_brightwellii.AAC.1
MLEAGEVHGRVGKVLLGLVQNGSELTMDGVEVLGDVVGLVVDRIKGDGRAHAIDAQLLDPLGHLPPARLGRAGIGGRTNADGSPRVSVVGATPPELS